MTDLALSAPWHVRLWRALVGTPASEPVQIGVSLAPEDAQPRFSPAAATAALVKFPWLSAAVQAVAADLAGLPLTVYDGKAEPVPGDETPGSLPWLLAHPSSRTSAEVLRRQIAIDAVLSGSAYVLIIEGTRGGVPAALQRVHPHHIVPVVDDTQAVVAYRLPATGRVLPVESVLHFRLPGWEPDASSVTGTGAAEVLKDWLNAEAAIMSSIERGSSRGRLDFLLTPASPETAIGRDKADEIAAYYERQAKRGGALVVGSHLQATPLSMTPRDLEQATTLNASRDAQLAVVGVPPVRVGIPGANYATDQAQRRGYWEGLRSLARLLDSTWTLLAERVDRRWYVAHDFDEVEALQESRTEQVQRVQAHILNGMDPADAYELEGLDEAAERMRQSRAAELAEANRPPPAEEPTEDPDNTDEARGLRLIRAAEAGLLGG